MTGSLGSKVRTLIGWLVSCDFIRISGCYLVVWVLAKPFVFPAVREEMSGWGGLLWPLSTLRMCIVDSGRCSELPFTNKCPDDPAGWSLCGWLGRVAHPTGLSWDRGRDGPTRRSLDGQQLQVWDLSCLQFLFKREVFLLSQKGPAFG